MKSRPPRRRAQSAARRVESHRRPRSPRPSRRPRPGSRRAPTPPSTLPNSRAHWLSGARARHRRPHPPLPSPMPTHPLPPHPIPCPRPRIPSASAGSRPSPAPLTGTPLRSEVWAQRRSRPRAGVRRLLWRQVIAQSSPSSCYRHASAYAVSSRSAADAATPDAERLHEPVNDAARAGARDRRPRLVTGSYHSGSVPVSTTIYVSSVDFYSYL